MKLERDFYMRDGLTVARELIGKKLVHRSPEGLAAGIIVETEAYIGPEDAGSHAYKARRTKRTAIQYGPGGYAWAPSSGQTVLVIKGGPGGREQCVAGAMQDPPADLAPGEVAIQGPGGAEIRLRSGGTVEIRGNTVEIWGRLLIDGQAYKPCTCGEGGALG